MSSKIYTKTGDQGTSSLLGGTKVSKADARLEAYGTVDELNSFIGVLRDSLNTDFIYHDLLMNIQNQLFELGSELAIDLDNPPKFEISRIQDKDILTLEHTIDQMEALLPPLKNFILPGGCLSASQSHVCRTVCRRAERRVVSLGNQDNRMSPILAKYLNRLSDFFFVLARYISMTLHGTETIWTSR